MINPKIRDENSDISRRRRRQPVKTDNPVGKRIVELLEDRDFGWLSSATGIPQSTISDYVQRGISRADNAVKLARALDTTVEFLVEGRQSGSKRMLIDANDADWVEVPEYSLFEIDEFGKLDPISIIPMRKDWLYTSLGENSGLWLARLPARYDALTIGTGTPLFCKDHRDGERLSEGTFYLFRINGGIVMAPFTYRDGGSTDDAVHSRDLGNDEDQYQVVARVVGQLARPI